MDIPREFDDIRPYMPEELPHVFEELLADPMFCGILQSFYKDIPLEMLRAKLLACRDNLEVQKVFFLPLIHRLWKNCTQGCTFDHTAVTDKKQPYTYISNHRDIVLDAAFLSALLVEAGFPSTVEIAIGDNLLIYPWIKKLVRVNKTFIVQRSVTARELLASSRRMSEYMHFAVAQKSESLWIAQREGRAKDSNDRTQESVLKMMALGGGGNAVENIRSLHIVPLTISYELDPCDFLKAREFQMKRDEPTYKKTQAEDLLNMKTGIFGYKGHIHYALAQPVNTWIDEIAGLPKAQFFAELARRIDLAIHHNYQIYPSNYIAADMLEEGQRYAAHYTPEEREAFLQYLSERTAMVELPSPDGKFLRERLLTMYANPLYNHEAAVR
ncbi:MAG: 1-acyl-sn-glycerol-3-phosphate acyltransferase [Alloprevotella sp.]